MAKITQQDTSPPMIKAWSFSTLTLYEECPAKVKFSKIDKITEPKNAILERGTFLHSLCERYLRDGGALPVELTKLERQLVYLKQKQAIPEAEFAFRKDWSRCGWFDHDCWLRVKADAVVPPFIDGDGRAEIWDWKSGKVSTEHGKYDDQLELYAIAMFLNYPFAETVDAVLAFIDHGVVMEADEVFQRAQLEALKEKWAARALPLLSDTVFAPRPSAKACQWCFYSKAKNGNCTY